MDSSTASHDPVDRLRSDLDTIRSAIGNDLPFGRADIRFCWLAAIGTAIYGLLYYLGMRVGALRLLAALPLLLPLSAYLVYMVVKSRRSSGLLAVRRKEYRYAVAVSLILAGGIYLLRPWAVEQGVEMHLYNGIAVMMLGIALVAVTLLPFNTAVAYRRLSLGFAAVMTLAIGWAIASTEGHPNQVVLVVWAVVFLVANSMMMSWFLRRHESRSGASTQDDDAA